MPDLRSPDPAPKTANGALPELSIHPQAPNDGTNKSSDKSHMMSIHGDMVRDPLSQTLFSAEWLLQAANRTGLTPFAHTNVHTCMDTECVQDYMGHRWIIYCSSTISSFGSRVGLNACTLQAAKRRAVQELLFFASVGDLRRCERIVRLWKLEVRLSCLAGVLRGVFLPHGCCVPGTGCVAALWRA